MACDRLTGIDWWSHREGMGGDGINPLNLKDLLQESQSFKFITLFTYILFIYLHQYFILVRDSSRAGAYHGNTEHKVGIHMGWDVNLSQFSGL